MESYFISGLSMPLQRHLSRLYNDTKKSSDFVKEPVQNAEDPEIKALHRKLRIQKDRLVSWGLEWSDPSQSSEVLIDSSISRAGLSEIVGSIMSTIKETLAEVEPLWLSSKRMVGDDSKSSPADRDRDRKLPVVTWDKARFTDLVRDLTVSIDTLYDLSRTRSSGAAAGGSANPSAKTTSPWALDRGSSTEDLRPFESSRMQVPQQINSATLTRIESSHLPLAPPGMQTREVVFMSKQVYADFARARGLRQGYSPLLLEYAYFDPVYADTGIMPSLARFERLSSGLQAEMQRPSNAWIGIPRLLGYFEDMEHSRLGLVYNFPSGYNAVVPSDVAAHDPRSCLLSLGDMLGSPSTEPRLEVKFRLASNLASTVFEMHARGIAHGSLGDASVLFGRNTEPGTAATDISRADMRKPLISGFDLFPDTPSPDGNRQSLLFRHPLNPQSFSPESTPIVDADPRAFDLYSVAMLLLSIGLWTKVENLVPHRESASVSETVLEQLAVQCGTLYMKAVQTCWNAMETVVSAKTPGDSHLARVELKVSRCLDACCVLDTMSSFEDPPEENVRREGTFGAMSTPTTSQSVTPTTSFYQKPSADVNKPLPDRSLGKGRSTDEAKPPLPSLSRPPTFTKPVETAPPKPPKAAKSESVRLKLFPQVPLPPAVIEQWHTFLMPQINFALRNFYHNHPESVEISLESVGESLRNTKPTVLVVCTSVSKVRHILKRKLGAVFDGSSGFSLKVCSGRVLRSRKDGPVQTAGAGTAAAEGPKRSQVNELGNIKPVMASNCQFQERPTNGASIGAWIGDRHLPPVSFGGLVLVDSKPFGMTVHHMLDDPDALDAAAARESQKTLRSSSAAAGGSSATQEVEALGQSLLDWYAELQADSSVASSSGDDFACEFSDTNSAVSESDLTSEWSDSSDEEDNNGSDSGGEPGDLPGVEPGFGEGYIVTQPALDDVEKDFYPDEETQDDDHLDSCGLGDIFASSGVRRRVDAQGLVHEIDWALFEFKEERQPADNVIPYLPLSTSAALGGGVTASPVLHPTTVAPSSALPGLEVQCMARTSGLQTGRILPTITSVKIYGRVSPSHTYQISGSSYSAAPRPGAVVTTTTTTTTNSRRSMPIGIPGDSGAWIVEREHGRLCGHVLAWSERKKVAYLCPMDVLMLDIAETLAAGEVRLPGGDAVVTLQDMDEPGKREGWQKRGGKGSRGKNKEGENDDEDEGYHDEHHMKMEGFEKEVCAPLTKKEELVGRLGKMHLGGSNVGTAC